MGIRGFDNANHYLNHLLTDADSREPLVAATGGLPLGIISKIENDLRAMERLSIKPVFVFSGLPLASRPPQKGPDPHAEREASIKNEAWSYYESGQVARAIMQLTAIRNGSWTDWKDLLRAIIRLFRHRFVDFVIAPYIEFAQGYIHAIYSSTECLLWPVERVITSTDWDSTFQFVEKNRVLVDLNLTSEQFLDMSILAGCSLSRTYPPIATDFAIKTVIDLMHHHKSGILVCQNWRDSQFKTQAYIDAFWKARLAVKFSLVLTTEGNCVPLPTVIAPHQAFSVQDVPGDLDEIFSPRIPDELYFYICRGLISSQVVGWMTSGIVHETQPLADTPDYHRFVKDVITEGPTSPRCTTIALLAHSLHAEWGKRRVNAHYFFDPPYAGPQGAPVPFNDPATQSLVEKAAKWSVPLSTIEAELRRQNSSTIDLKLCIGALVNGELAGPRTKDQVLDKKDEIVANILWRFMELRGEAVTVHILLSGSARRNREDYNDITLSLPFQTEVNTGFGILAKTYLDATTYHHDETITEETAATDKAKQAKRDALSFVEQSFSSIKSPIQEIERGFRFWDSIMTAVRSLDKEQGPSPSLTQRIVGKDIIEQFETADKWLKPMRP
ncbi:hypothetical protein IAU60_001845 [Kwoniella sp. DSM 27419]